MLFRKKKTDNVKISADATLDKFLCGFFSFLDLLGAHDSNIILIIIIKKYNKNFPIIYTFSIFQPSLNSCTIEIVV